MNVDTEKQRGLLQRGEDGEQSHKRDANTLNKE